MPLKKKKNAHPCVQCPAAAPTTRLRTSLQDTLALPAALPVSSYAWNLVSAVVEGATGIDYLSYMEDTVFTALDTERLIAEHQDSILIPIASFYNAENGKLILAPQVNNSYKWASGGLVGTTTDLVNFIHNLYATNFLSKEVIKELHRPNTTRIGQSTN